MTQPPNKPSIVHRSPLHGLHLHTTSPSPNGSPTKSLESYASPPQTLTVTCSEPHCNNAVIVIPHGVNTSIQSTSGETVIYIKARCNECEPPVLVFDLWAVRMGEEREDKDEEEEKWGGWNAPEWDEE